MPFLLGLNDIIIRATDDELVELVLDVIARTHDKAAHRCVLSAHAA